MRERILLTGPGGRVGKEIVPLLRAEFALRLFDLRHLAPEGDDECVTGDVRNLPLLEDACRGIGAMVHLAAIPDEADFESQLLPMNILGVYNAFEAARRAGVRRMIFASTGQTVLNYGPGKWVTPDMPVRPSTVYGCTKVFGEALGRHYADCHGLATICIRLCWFQPYASELLRTRPRMRPEWCSPRDLVQLVVKSIRSAVDFAVFFGISNNTGRYWDTRNALELVGYQPRDNAEDYAGLTPKECEAGSR